MNSKQVRPVRTFVSTLDKLNAKELKVTTFNRHAYEELLRLRNNKELKVTTFNRHAYEELRDK